MCGELRPGRRCEAEPARFGIARLVAEKDGSVGAAIGRPATGNAAGLLEGGLRGQWRCHGLGLWIPGVGVRGGAADAFRRKRGEVSQRRVPGRGALEQLDPGECHCAGECNPAQPAFRVKRAFHRANKNGMIEL